MKLNCLNLAIANAFNLKRFFWLSEHKSDCAKRMRINFLFLKLVRK